MDHIEYLKRISAPPSRFEAQVIVEQVIDAEIQNLIYQSHHGYYHEHVKAKGYPLPRDLLNSAPYHARPELEVFLRQAVQHRKNVILLGCEGSGKTTLIHRIIGDLAHDDPGIFIYVDVSDVDVSPDTDCYQIIQKTCYRRKSWRHAGGT